MSRPFPTSRSRLRALVPLACVLALLAGCAMKTYRLAFGISPETEARVEISGSRPSLQVQNLGDEVLHVVTEGRTERHEDLLAPGGETPSRRLDGPLLVRLRVDGPRPGEARVIARGVVGMVLDRTLPAQP